MIIPDYLKLGDKVAVIAPAGRIEAAVVERCLEVLREWGLMPVLGNNVTGSYGRYSGTVEQRLEDIDCALSDTQIKAILCARGGYGAIQLLEHLSLEKVRENAKWLIGYSDITLLHSFWQRAGVASLHSVMCKNIGEQPDYQSAQSTRRYLMGQAQNYSLPVHPLNRQGLATGHLQGGNLAVFSALHSTCYDFCYDDCILFIEDIAESPYKIERMLYSLKYSGVFDRIQALIVGQFAQCDDDPLMHRTLYQLIWDMIKEYDFPVCFDFPVGHVDYNLAMPEGVVCRLDISSQQVSLSFS